MLPECHRIKRIHPGMALGQVDCLLQGLSNQWEVMTWYVCCRFFCCPEMGLNWIADGQVYDQKAPQVVLRHYYPLRLPWPLIMRVRALRQQARH